jgi:DNA uptake protein ComE-like DNA-binding protein
MRSRITAGFLILAVAPVLVSCGWSSANQDEREQKIRDQAARAAEKAKPAIEHAAKKAGEVARSAAEDARAAADGAREGWRRSGHRLDVNSASEDQIAALPGISRRDARRIVANRPYHDPHGLVEKGVLSEESYSRIQDGISAR